MLNYLTKKCIGKIISLRYILVASFILFIGVNHAQAAISFVKNVGAIATKGAHTQLQIVVPAAGVEAGNTVIIAIATDYNSGNIPTIPSCADSKGNTYTIDREYNYNNSMQGSICSASITTALVSGDTITVTHADLNASAMSASEFSGLLTAGAIDQTAVAVSLTTAVDSTVTATTAQADELLFGSIANEHPPTTTFAPGGVFISLPGVGTSGSAAASNMTAFAEYSIVSSTGTYNATGTLSQASDSIAIIATYKAVTAPPAESLSCLVTTAAACTSGGGIIMLRMSGATNAHAELPSQGNGNYAGNVICCSGVTGLGNSCTAPSAVVVKLFGATNAHIERNDQSNYSGANNACMSVPSGGTVSVAYQANNCTGFDTIIASISSLLTNAHIGGPNEYTNKICGTAVGGVANKGTSGTVTSSVFDSTGSANGGGYHSVYWKGTLGAGATGKVRFQFAAADATTGPWSFIGGTTCQAGDWFTTSGPEAPVELIGTGVSAPTCRSAWNNKRYFRYKIQICSDDCVTAGPNTPTVNGVVVSWAQ